MGDATAKGMIAYVEEVVEKAAENDEATKEEVSVAEEPAAAVEESAISAGCTNTPKTRERESRRCRPAADCGCWRREREEENAVCA